MGRLWKYAFGLTALSFVGFGIAFAFRQSDSPILLGLVYASTGILVVAVAIALFAISLIGDRP
jgi:hypothetical protein